MVDGAATVVKICMKSLVQHIRTETDEKHRFVNTHVRYAEMKTTAQVRHPS